MRRGWRLRSRARGAVLALHVVEQRAVADRRSAFSAYTIPTDAPGSDGTLEWNATTLVLVEASAAGSTGIGYSYATRATAVLIADTLAGVVEGRAAFDIGAAWRAMIVAIRNLGRPGIPSMAVAAVDNALWDLKGALLGTAVVDCSAP